MVSYGFEVSHDVAVPVTEGGDIAVGLVVSVVIAFVLVVSFVSIALVKSLVISFVIDLDIALVIG